MSEKLKENVLNIEHISKDLYISAKNTACLYSGTINIDDYYFCKIDEITFELEEKFPKKEALENFIGTMNIPGINFIYLITGTKEGVNFYYGVSRNLEQKVKSEILTPKDVSKTILCPALRGNFRGSKVSILNETEKHSLYKTIGNFKIVSLLQGVPSANEEDEKFQSIERLVDVMVGDDFALMLVVKSLSLDEIDIIRNRIYSFYNDINPNSKHSFQENSRNNTTTITIDESGRSTQKNNGTNKGTTTDYVVSNSKKQSGSEGSSESTVVTNFTNNSRTTQTEINNSSSKTVEIVNKRLQDLIKYIDEIVLKRLDYGMGKGLFLSSIVLFGNSRGTLIKLANTMKAVYGSETHNQLPLKVSEITNEESKISFKNFQIPLIKYQKTIPNEEIQKRTIYFEYLKDTQSVYLANWMTSKELSLIAGIPQKEVIGLSLKEEIEFGLNVKPCDNPISLGHLVQNGNVCDGSNSLPNIEVSLDKNDLNKHIFITGTTGAGKTTTCQRLLLSSGSNFLVIEPAKTEYRILKDQYPDMLVFTLGKEDATPFRLNPFEFFKNEGISSRVDMIKASMEASFDMEAAIPQLLEAALYKCYENKGWDLATNKNIEYENPFEENVNAFPTLSDLVNEIESIVDSQGFDDRLKKDYIGSIKARLKGLMVGSKGLMLNTSRSINFNDLLDKKVILELENIKSSSDKSLIMGFVLANLNEALKEKYNSSNGKFTHITLIEEAHRLLSKYEYGDNPNKKHGIEMFSDMLAEVRKYGESLIIVDQIPNKMTPEVLKNTNTKIIHKIFAQDDKDAVGNIMALSEEQKEHLSYLVPGRVVMMHPGLDKAIQVQISKDENNNTERIPPKDIDLRDQILNYYATNYKSGIIPGLENLNEKPSVSFVDKWMTTEKRFKDELIKISQGKKNSSQDKLFLSMLEDLRKALGKTEDISLLLSKDKTAQEKITSFFNDVIKNKTVYITDDSKLLAILRLIK